MPNDTLGVLTAPYNLESANDAARLLREIDTYSERRHVAIDVVEAPFDRYAVRVFHLYAPYRDATLYCDLETFHYIATDG